VLPSRRPHLGVRSFKVRLRTIEPGAASVERRHAGQPIVLVRSGCVRLLIDGGPQRFSAPCTMLVPPLPIGCCAACACGRG
jgi:hypothetical protein